MARTQKIIHISVVVLFLIAIMFYVLGSVTSAIIFSVIGAVVEATAWIGLFSTESSIGESKESD